MTTYSWHRATTWHYLQRDGAATGVQAPASANPTFSADVRKSVDGTMAEIETALNCRLAEHPADSDTPLDEGWLRSVGFGESPHEFPLGLHIDPPDQDPDIPRRALVVNVKSASLIDCNNIDRVWLHLCDWKTRGDVRRLCQALGLTLKPAEEGT